MADSVFIPQHDRLIPPFPESDAMIKHLGGINTDQFELLYPLLAKFQTDIITGATTFCWLYIPNPNALHTKFLALSKMRRTPDESSCHSTLGLAFGTAVQDLKTHLYGRRLESAPRLPSRPQISLSSKQGDKKEVVITLLSHLTEEVLSSAAFKRLCLSVH